jgi:hypothetical protein
MIDILNWIKAHEIDFGLLICGCLFIWQGIHGAKEGEFIAVFRFPAEIDQRPMWRVDKKVAKWVGAFLFTLGIGCFIAAIMMMTNFKISI